MNPRTLLGAAVAASISLAAVAAAPRGPAPAPAAAPKAAAPSNNAIHVIAPYRHGGTWVFDDPRRGLVREAFVSGADDWMERMASTVPGGRERGFTLLFSAKPFPGARRLQFRRADMGGAWYYDPAMKHEGWLCSTLFDYFPTPPRELYAQVKPRAPRG